MRVPRFYTQQPLSHADSITLDEQASHHLLRVLRLRCGDPVVLFNGDGKNYCGTLGEAKGKLATVNVSEKQEARTESDLQIALGQGVSRGDRMDFVLQKSVELGVGTVTPIWTNRSQVQLSGPRLEKRLTHWRAIMQSACEQSGRSVIPSLKHASTLTDWCSSTDAKLQLVLDPDASLTLRDFSAVTRVAILIGPEGGLEMEEIRLAEAIGFKRVRLGPRTLRTETAALAALSAVQTLWGDLAG